jgi:hypothetical protein
MSLAMNFLYDARKHANSCEYEDARVYFTSALKEVDKYGCSPRKGPAFERILICKLYICESACCYRDVFWRTCVWSM